MCAFAYSVIAAGTAGFLHGFGLMLHFSNVRLVDPEFNSLSLGSLTVSSEGVILSRDQPPPPGAEIIEGNGACLAPGIVDWGVFVGEPGARHRESFRSATRAASAGGVSCLITRPDTNPPIDSPELLHFVRRRAEAEAHVRVFPMAALTRGLAGQAMAELGFLVDAGAVAFTDGFRAIADSRVMARCLTYAASLGALVVGHPQDPWLSAGAVATAGKFATLLGLATVSPIAERIGLERDLALVEITGARYHADQITTATSLEALRRAKASGLDVTAGISIHHLTLNEFDIAGYRTFFRLIPPLRGEDDRRAMVQAVREGLIDVIASFHTPHDEESKRLPFEEAAPGAVGLETLLPAALRLYHAGELTLPELWRALSLNPARRLGLPFGRLSPGAPADFVLFDPDAPFVLDRFRLRSKAKNTPFDGAVLQGRVLGTWVAGRLVYNGSQPSP